MKLVHSLMIGAGVLAIGAGPLAKSACANSGFGPQVERVDLKEKGGIHIDVLLKNVSNNKHVNAVNIQPTKSAMELPLDGFVKCAKDKGTDFIGAKAYFGTVGLQNGQIVESAVLHSADYNPSFTTWQGVGKGQWVDESGNHEPFVVPLAAVKNGHPALRFDPVAELDKKLQQHLSEGKSKTEFYQNEQMITVKRPISLSGTCRDAAESSGLGKQPNTGNVISSGYRTIMASLTIRYEGDPAINETPVLNAQMANNPNQIGNNFPIQLDSASFQPNIPHYTGKCVPEQNRNIRINFQFSGNGDGLLDLRVVPDSSNVYGTTPGPYANFSSLPVNAKATKHIDFAFPLIQILSQDQYAYMAASSNKTWSHNMRLEGRFKKDGGEWSQWEELDTAVFKHRCTPQVNVQMGGNGGKIGFDNGNGGNGETPKLKVAPGAGNNYAKPQMQLQMNQGGGDPKPELQINKNEAPEAGLILPAVQKSREAAR